MRSFLAAVALAALCAHAARASPSSARASGLPGLSDLANAEQCVCQSPDAKKQLIRGAGQVERCQQGYYCDCLSKTVQKCDAFLPMFNEDVQSCDFSYDCETYLEGTTAGPATASTQTASQTPALPPTAQPTVATETTAAAPTSPPEPCTCRDASRDLQLIRGSDQEARCQQGDYCDCQAKTVRKCGAFLPMFNEDVQSCGFAFDCKEFFNGPTVPTDGPSTASPAPTRPTEPETAAPDVPTPAPEPCTCKDALRHFQLIRGPSQVDQCQQGYYCNCLSKTVQKCDGFLPMFNEDVEDCGFSYDCEAYLGVGPATAASRVTSRAPSSGPTSSWLPDAASGGSHRLALSTTLFALSAVLTIVNLVLLYRRVCWQGAPRRVPHARLPDPLPALYTRGFANGAHKAPLESAA